MFPQDDTCAKCPGDILKGDLHEKINVIRCELEPLLSILILARPLRPRGYEVPLGCC